MTEAWWPGEDEPDRPLPNSVKVRVPAKINLHLGVGPVRPDGYHELRTVYQAIAMYDEVTARRGDTLTLTMEGEGAGELALDDSNLIIRAASALAARMIRLLSSSSSVPAPSPSMVRVSVSPARAVSSSNRLIAW